MYSHPHSCPLASVDAANVIVVKSAVGWSEYITRPPYLAPHLLSAMSSRLNPDLGVGTCSPIK